MKPLEKGRRALNWMGVHFADDEPVSGQLKLSQKLYSIAFTVVFIAIGALHVTTFWKVQLINTAEFFFVLLQLLMSLHACSTLFTIYSCGSGISTVFRCLTEMYEKCKWISHNTHAQCSVVYFNCEKNYISSESFKDPDDRLQAINVKYEWIYGYLRKSLLNGFCIQLILISMLTILLSHFLHGEFDVAYLFHPFQIRWRKN